MAYRQSRAAKTEEEEVEISLVSEIFPDIDSMVINMTYYQNLANPILMVRTINVFPSSPSEFEMPCMDDECEEGGFDLNTVISGMVKKRKRTAKGKIACAGKNAQEDDHASVSYEISIKFIDRRRARK